VTTSEDDSTVAQLRRTFDEAAGRAPVTLERSFTVSRQPRPRQRVARVLVACLAIAVLVPLSFVVVHSESTVPTVAASGRAAIEPPAPGWRWEMWANVQLQVPDSWDRNQDIHRACSIEDEIPGFVSRPDGSGIMEICSNWTEVPTSLPNMAFLDEFPGTPKPGTPHVSERDRHDQEDRFHRGDGHREGRCTSASHPRNRPGRHRDERRGLPGRRSDSGICARRVDRSVDC